MEDDHLLQPKNPVFSVFETLRFGQILDGGALFEGGAYIFFGGRDIYFLPVSTGGIFLRYF